MQKRSIQIGDKVWCWNDHRDYVVKGFKTVKIGDREVIKIVTTTGKEMYWDEAVPRQRSSDTFWGRLFFGR